MPYSHPQPIDRKEAYRKVRHLLIGAAAFAGTAGYINSVALGFFHTPVSHMTGAVSHLGGDLAAGQFLDAWASLSIVLGFVLGAALAGIIVGAWKLVPGRRYGVALMVEGALLMLATGFLLTKQRLGLGVVAMACGVQNATTSSYCGLIIRTTHVTGTVTDIGVMLGHWLRHRQIELWKLRFLACLVLAFGVGGWIGAVTERHFGPGCLSVAAIGCTLAGGIFWFVTHRGLVDLMQDLAITPQPPRTSSFPER
jgi:uncharacterized membrane protein YoaK (UPF0700 family)